MGRSRGLEADISRSSVGGWRVLNQRTFWNPRIREENSGYIGRDLSTNKSSRCADMVKLLDYSRRTSGRAAVSRHQTEFVGFGIKVISFATPRSAYPR